MGREGAQARRPLRMGGCYIFGLLGWFRLVTGGLGNIDHNTGKIRTATRHVGKGHCRISPI
eukprot:6478549-Amphidinium_carterae.1